MFISVIRFMSLSYLQGFAVEDQGAAAVTKPLTTWDVKILVAALQAIVSLK